MIVKEKKCVLRKYFENVQVFNIGYPCKNVTKYYLHIRSFVSEHSKNFFILIFKKCISQPPLLADGSAKHANFFLRAP